MGADYSCDRCDYAIDVGGHDSEPKVQADGTTYCDTCLEYRHGFRELLSKTHLDYCAVYRDMTGNEFDPNSTDDVDEREWIEGDLVTDNADTPGPALSRNEDVGTDSSVGYSYWLELHIRQEGAQGAVPNNKGCRVVSPRITGPRDLVYALTGIDDHFDAIKKEVANYRELVSKHEANNG